MVFIGDQYVSNIYAGLNILLRENLGYGSLQDWEMAQTQISDCACDWQFTNAACLSHRIGSSEDATVVDDGTRSSSSHYACASSECTAFPFYFFFFFF